MGAPETKLTPELQAFLERQPLFFVATAPLRSDAHVNLSPKGLDCLRVLSPTEIAYLDLTGSGNETSAHVLENGRVTLMTCAFEGPPTILRIYGQGSVYLPDSPRWAELRPRFADLEGARQIIAIRIQRVQTSCGYAVPLMEFKAHRPLLTKWAKVKGPDGLAEYRAEKNETSIDGLQTHLGQRARKASSEPAR